MLSINLWFVCNPIYATKISLHKKLSIAAKQGKQSMQLLIKKIRVQDYKDGKEVWLEKIASVNS